MDKSAFDHGLDFNAFIQLKPLLIHLGVADYVSLILLFLGAVAYLSCGRLWAKPDPYLYKLYERPQEKFGSIGKDESTTDIAKQLTEQSRDLVIFWGSQSGTAEGLAHRLARDCSARFGLNVLVADLSDYEHDTISQIPHSKFAIFLISTYGEGDPSDNTCDFLTWLQSRSTSLEHLRYAAFGLGNSNYVYYNKVVDDVVKYLDSLQAVSLLPVGKADDANSGTEEDFATWRDDLFAMFHAKLSLQEHVPVYTPTIQVVERGEDEQNTNRDQYEVPKALKLSRRTQRDYTAITQLPLREVRSLTRDRNTGRSCLHFEVDAKAHPQIKYKTGDHLAIWPTTAVGEVERLLTVLGLQAKQQTEITVTSLESQVELKIPQHCTIASLFRHHLEVGAPVSRDTVTALIQLTPHEAVKAVLQDLSDKTTYSDFVARNHITFARLLEHTLAQDSTASWSHLPLAFVIESLRPMQPRYYSISSSSMTSPRQMAITVAVSPSELRLNSAVSIPGLTTSYLSGLEMGAGPCIWAHVRRSTFKMPFLHKTPIVLIAAGTGLAPFRAFLHERAQMAQISDQEIGKILLVFGCRHPDQDYLYREEIEALQNGPLKGKLEVITAFSRVAGQPKVYVQNRLNESQVKSQILDTLCQQEGNLYFCGSTTMAKAAGRTIVDAVQEYRKGSDADAKAWMDTMKRSKRWQEDVWG